MDILSLRNNYISNIGNTLNKLKNKVVLLKQLEDSLKLQGGNLRGKRRKNKQVVSSASSAVEVQEVPKVKEEEKVPEVLEVKKSVVPEVKEEEKVPETQITKPAPTTTSSAPEPEPEPAPTTTTPSAVVESAAVESAAVVNEKKSENELNELKEIEKSLANFGNNINKVQESIVKRQKEVKSKTRELYNNITKIVSYVESIHGIHDKSPDDLKSQVMKLANNNSLLVATLAKLENEINTGFPTIKQELEKIESQVELISSNEDEQITELSKIAELLNKIKLPELELPSNKSPEIPTQPVPSTQSEE
jgi:iron-sulfur cluster repair protein YtfE (RIC family)